MGGPRLNSDVLKRWQVYITCSLWYRKNRVIVGGYYILQPRWLTSGCLLFLRAYNFSIVKTCKIMKMKTTTILHTTAINRSTVAIEVFMLRCQIVEVIKKEKRV